MTQSVYNYSFCNSKFYQIGNFEKSFFDISKKMQKHFQTKGQIFICNSIDTIYSKLSTLRTALNHEAYMGDLDVKLSFNRGIFGYLPERFQTAFPKNFMMNMSGEILIWVFLVEKSYADGKSVWDSFCKL